jgi:signal transduction histidine kinase
MTRLALRDHIVEILSFVAEDCESAQTDRQQVQKSKGDGPKGSRIQHSAAEIHAALRLDSGFDIDQMVSEYRALRASVVKLWARRGQPMALTDVEDLTRFNEAIDQAIAESVAEYTRLMNESKNLFLGIIGHDLRNPIGAASMAGEALKKLSTPDSKQMALASHIVDATQRGLQILNDLLEVTRSAFGTDIPIARAPMDMASVARRIVAEMRSIAKGRRIDVATDGDTNGEWDETRIGQVFSNLIGNAVEYSLPDSTISVAVKGGSSDVAISVHNLGTAIPADELANLFEMLTRGSSAESERRGSGHLGLGLYITKKIVLAHDGDIDVSSDESGTTFAVRLPRR